MIPTARLRPYYLLMRLDRPIGSLLLLWPTYWALWIAAEGLPDLKVLAVFSVGVVLMRSAGCVINDVADRNVDGRVERTRNRPLATGQLGVKQALWLFAGLLLLAFVLVLTMNNLTIGLSFVAVALAACYPFMKRYTHLPQVVLGAAYGWSIPMAFAAQSNQLPDYCWLLFVGNLCWTVAYDTYYAMVDRNDDLKVGIKSTAVLFGRYDKLMIALLQLATLVCLLLVGLTLQLGYSYYAGLLIAAGLFLQQQWQTRHRDTEQCFKAFLANNRVGAVIFVGVALNYLELAMRQ